MTIEETKGEFLMLILSLNCQWKILLKKYIISLHLNFIIKLTSYLLHFDIGHLMFCDVSLMIIEYD